MFLERFKSYIFHIFSWKKLSFEAVDFKFVDQNTISNGAPTTETHVKFWNNMSCSPNLKAIAKWIWIYIRKICIISKNVKLQYYNKWELQGMFIYDYTVVFMNITKSQALIWKKCPNDNFCAFLGSKYHKPYSLDKISN